MCLCSSRGTIVDRTSNEKKTAICDKLRTDMSHKAVFFMSP